MNKGITLATGEWLYFLGADDQLYDANVLTNIAQEISPNVSLIFGKVEYVVTKQQPFILSANQNIKHPNWSWKIWLRNAVHHQGTFFHKNIFKTHSYNTKYKVLADYALNLELYLEKARYTVTAITIAKCSADGVSKQGNWSLYREEVRLKTHISNKVLTPFFWGIAMLKYLIRKRQDVKH